MKLNDEELKSLWQQDTRQSTGSRQDCLSFELLVRAGEGNLRREERESAAKHLAACADCSDEYRVALAVNEWAAQPATQRSLPPGLVVHTPPPENWRRRLALLIKRRASFSPLALAITTALLLVTLGLGVWLLTLRQQNQTLVARLNEQRDQFAESPPDASAEDQQRRQSEPTAQPAGQEDLKAENQKLKKELAELSQPQLNLPQMDVDPNDETRGSSGVKDKIAAFNVPPASSYFTINLPGAGSKPFAHYVIDLMDAKTNKVVWSGQRRQDKETTFTLTLAKRGIPAGQYRIRVYGLDGKGRQLLSNYDIQINYPSHAAQ